MFKTTIMAIQIIWETTRIGANLSKSYTSGTALQKCVTQWRSQDIVVARAQRGHTTFVRTSTRSAEAYREFGHGEGILSMIWGHPPPKI